MCLKMWNCASTWSDPVYHDVCVRSLSVGALSKATKPLAWFLGQHLGVFLLSLHFTIPACSLLPVSLAGWYCLLSETHVRCFHRMSLFDRADSRASHFANIYLANTEMFRGQSIRV